jgi:hypothetical protein
VSDSVTTINDATSKSLEKIDEATSNAVSQVKQAASSKVPITDPKYLPKFDVVDPNTGKWVTPNDSNYDAVKSQLGGDAGTVNPNKSTACLNALKKWRETHPSSSTASNSSR